MSEYPGVLVTLEGGEASGKSTLQRGLYEQISDDGHTALVPDEIEPLHEPGGTGLGERLRELILNSDAELDPVEATLLFNAARASLAREVLIPLLEAGKLLLVDRFVDSTVVYQSVDGGLTPDEITPVNEFGARGLVPDLTLLIDLPPEVALARRNSGDSSDDRYESRELEFHREVRRAYLEQAARHPDRFVVLDGQHAPGELVEQAGAALRSRLNVLDSG